MPSMSKLTLAAALVVTLVTAQEPAAAMDPALGAAGGAANTVGEVAAEAPAEMDVGEPEAAVDPALGAAGGAADTVGEVAAEALAEMVVREPDAAVDPVLGAGQKVQDISTQQASLRGAADSTGEVEVEAQADVEEPVASVDPALGADELMQEISAQLASLRQAGDMMGEAEVEAQAEVEADCRSGLVGRVYKAAPACLSACSYTCGVIREAINAYLTKGGRPAAKKVMCRHKWAYACPLKKKNLNKCRKFISKAGSAGLPKSMGELNRQCR